MKVGKSILFLAILVVFSFAFLPGCGGDASSGVSSFLNDNAGTGGSISGTSGSSDSNGSSSTGSGSGTAVSDDVTYGSGGGAGSTDGSSGSGSTAGVEYNPEYYVYEDAPQTGKSFKSGADKGEFLILPSTMTPPTGFQIAPNTELNFSDGTIVESDENGGFSASQIPDDIRADALADPQDQPTIMVKTAEGKSGMVSIAIESEEADTSQTPAMDDDGKGDQPIAIEIAPDTFAVTNSQSQLLHVVRLNANGKVIKATNVTWAVEPVEYADSLVPFTDDSSYALFTAPDTLTETSVEVTIKATILSESLEISDTATGLITNSTDMVRIYGKLFELDGNSPIADTMIAVDLPQLPGLKPFYFTDITDEFGNYEIYVPPTPTDVVEGDRYRLLIQSELDVNYKRSMVRGMNASTGTFFIYVYPTDTELNVDVWRTDQIFVIPKPTPIRKFVRYSAWQVHNAVRRLIAEPNNQVREFFAGETINNPISYGVLKGWSWEELTDDPNYTLLLISPDEHNKVYVANPADYTYTWEHDVLPYIYDENNPVDWFKRADGTWVDTYDGNLVNITNTIYHYLPNMESPHRTTVVSWTAGATLFSSSLSVDNWTGDKDSGESMKINEFEVTRAFEGFGVIGTELPLFSYNGSGTAYVKLPTGVTVNDNDTVQFDNSFEGELTGMFGGDFTLIDTTAGGPHEGSKVEIHVLDLNERLEQAINQLLIIATGSVYKYTDEQQFEEVASFDVYVTGIIKIYKPEDIDHTDEPMAVLND